MCTSNLKFIEKGESFDYLSNEDTVSTNKHSDLTSDHLITEKKIFFILTAIIGFFAVTGLAAHYIKLNIEYQNSLILKQYVRLFLLDESSINTWFSSALLLFSSILLGVISYAKRKAGDEYTTYWAVLSVIFLCLSIDDISQIHERLNLMNFYIWDKLFYYSWVIFGIAFVLILFLFYFRFIFNLPSRTKNLFILSGVLFIGGTIGFEIIGWLYKSFYFEKGFAVVIIGTLEETLEMLGTSVFIYALLKYINNHLTNFTLRIDNKNS